VQRGCNSSPFLFVGINTFAHQLSILRVHTDFYSVRHTHNPVVTIGTFDGVHLGHNRLIQRINEIAKEIGGESVLLTFYPHPRMILYPDDDQIKLLNSPEEKVKLLEASGLNHLVIYPFSRDFSRLSAFDYVRDLLVTGLHAHTVVVGYDHRFGRNREGDHKTLLELAETFGFNIEEIPAELFDDIEVSSTKIRNALTKGDLDYARSFLGYSYEFTGTVVAGAGIGKQLGYPTANIQLDYSFKLIPSNGVYQVEVHLKDQTLTGLLNIGNRPTVHSDSQLVMEVHILDWSESIYGEQVRLVFVRKIRDEQKFGSIDELKSQISKDIAETRSIQ
jgi:riboflavin kinase / FMN adenylyltransferase